MKASGLDLCIWHFYVDRAKTKNLAEIGEKPPKSCYFMLLSPPRCYILGAICPYHLKANEWSCASDIYWRTAPNIWQKLAKNRQKAGFLLPLSPLRLFTLQNWMLYQRTALGLPLCTCHFQADRPIILAEIGKNQKQIFLVFFSEFF